MNQKNRKPAIRFKAFNDPWEQRKFGGLLESVPSKTFIKSPEINGKYEVVQQGNDPIMGYANGYPCEDYQETVIFGDHTLSLYKPQAPFFVATDGVRIVKGKDKSDGFFLFTLLEKYKPQSEGYKRYFSILSDTSCYFAKNLSEQQKIGEYFECINSLITLHQRKLDKLQNVKKACLEKMFPQNGESVPRIRFKGFTDTWEQRKVSEIANFSKGSGYSKGDLTKTGTPIILYGRLYTKYKFFINEVDTFTKPKEGAAYSQGNEVIIPASGETAEEIARASAIEKSGFLLGGDLNIIRPVGSVNPLFLALTFSNGEPQKQLTKRAQGKSVVHVRNSDIKEVFVSYPSQEEQSQIVAVFRNLEQIITLHQRKLDKLKNLKKACLEKMFV